ncbi:hypothetical protein OH76DRAFT_1423078 [Lentinus brumalis]|uniref:Uncharacterized protein n=1 Tax=Lentinus brumalis TaxID=2498619 RepID=A0A371CMM2_9APHY|nr:hypothetical protein OH76DRAFT_1423078 [Polyporus brumalis]
MAPTLAEATEARILKHHPGRKAPKENEHPDEHPMTTTTTILSQTCLYVKWRKTTALPGPAKTTERADHYVVVVQPSSPLHIGSRVRLELLSNSGFHSPDSPQPPVEYDTYDLFVEGVIGRVVVSVEEGATLVMKNINPWNVIRYAYITIPNTYDNITPLDPCQAMMRLAQNKIIRMNTTTWLDSNSRVGTRAPPAQALTSPYFDFQLTDTEMMEGQEAGSGTLVTSLRKRIGFRPTGTFGPSGAYYCGRMTQQ